MTREQSEEKPAGVDWESIHRRMDNIHLALDPELSQSQKVKQLILKQRAKALARGPGISAPTGESLELVTFLLADEKYGIESRYVSEVYALKELTPVPCTPDFVLGITNVRGRILSIIDIKKFFGLPPRGLNELDKIVIVKLNQIEVGIYADTISGVELITSQTIQPALPTLTGIRERYLKGVTADMLVVLDIVKLLTDPAIIVNEEVAI